MSWDSHKRVSRSVGFGVERKACVEGSQICEMIDAFGTGECFGEGGEQEAEEYREDSDDCKEFYQREGGVG